MALLGIDAQSIFQNALDALSLGSTYALFALGVAVVFGIMQLINFAHGELVMVGAFAIVLLGNPPWPLLILVTVGVSVVFALAMERVAFRPVRHANHATMLITSFAVSYLLQNLALVVLGSTPRTTNISTSLLQVVDFHGVIIGKLDIVTICITAVLLVGMVVFLSKTPLGMQMRAAAEDFETARVVGVRANTVIATAFVISGAFAGIGAFLVVAKIGVVQNTIGVAPVLAGFIAVVLGGMGSLPGAVVGGYILGLITVLLEAYLPIELRYYRDAFAYGLVIFVLLVRPQGLMPPRWKQTRV